MDEIKKQLDHLNDTFLEELIQKFLLPSVIGKEKINILWYTIETTKTAQSQGYNKDQARLINTFAGWAAAALGKCISHKATPEEFDEHMKTYEKMREEYNANVKLMKSHFEEVEAAKKQLVDYLMARDAVFFGTRNEIEVKAKQAAEAVLGFSPAEALNELMPKGEKVVPELLKTKNHHIMAYLERLIQFQADRKSAETSNYLTRKIEELTVRHKQKASDKMTEDLHEYVKQDQQENIKFWSKIEKLVNSHNESIIMEFCEFARMRRDVCNILWSRIDELNKRIKGWPFSYSPENHLPFGELLAMSGDTSGSYDRFVLQGMIMGLHEFLEKHKKNKAVEKYHGMLMGLKESMVASSSKLSAFEVRVYPSISNEDYTRVLSAVLETIDSTRQYVNISKLMNMAREKIPTIMELLINYPLRLINEKNEDINGFFNFTPYDYTLWYNYTPPKDEGPVHKRYIELIDLARPNSSGLNVRLFTRQYAVIPTMFHENEHYMGDLNEASVHLKTYIFSKKFYAQYSPELAIYDGVFLTLHQLFGRRINKGAVYKLNDIIELSYGTELSDADAREQATRTIDSINNIINSTNRGLKWCPEIKWPLLSKDEDKRNYDCLYDSLVRNYAQRKSITTSVFRQVIDKLYEAEHVLTIEQRQDSGLTDGETSEAEKALQQLIENGTFGRLHQEKGKEKTPIEWDSVKSTEGRTLYISKKSLAVRRFHSENKPCEWEDCELREWLNNHFIYEAFTKAERSLIEAVCLANDNGQDTTDRLFLLNAQQAKEMGADVDRECSDIDILKLPPAVVPAYGAGAARQAKNNLWWLRSNGKSNHFAAVVYYHGAIDSKGFNKYGAKGGVRPAFYLKTEMQKA